MIFEALQLHCDGEMVATKGICPGVPVAFESGACPGQVRRTVVLLGMVGEAGYSANLVLKLKGTTSIAPINADPLVVSLV